MKSYTWQQINNYRLKHQNLLDTKIDLPIPQIVSDSCGIQSQVFSAAQLAISIRTNNTTRSDIEKALWKDHTILKTWVHRGTIHLLSAEDLPLYVAARKFYDNRKWVKYFDYHGVNKKKYENYLQISKDILSDRPISREEFATRVSEEIKSPELKDLVLSKGWGTPLKPLAWKGTLAYGPGQGRNSTFINPRKYIKWKEFDPFEAMQEIVRRYLRTYGPSNPKLFTNWWYGGSGITQVRKVFDSIEDEVEIVDVDGWKGLVLKESIESIESEYSHSVKLLPLFDMYTIGLSRKDDLVPLLPQKYQKLVYRQQGWISAVVLVDGFIKGVWEYEVSKSDLHIKVKMFEEIDSKTVESIEGEVSRIGEFLNLETEISFR